MIDIAKLAGKMDALEAKFDGELAVIDGRLDDLEAGKKASEDFRVEMRKDWNEFIGGQKMFEKMQELRHKENQDAAAKTSNRVALWGLLITLFSLIAAGCMVYLTWKSSKYAQEDPAKYFHTEKAPEVSQYSTDHATIPPLRR